LSGADAAGVGMPRNPGTLPVVFPPRISRQGALARAPINPGYALSLRGAEHLAANWSTVAG